MQHAGSSDSLCHRLRATALRFHKASNRPTTCIPQHRSTGTPKMKLAVVLLLGVIAGAFSVTGEIDAHGGKSAVARSVPSRTHYRDLFKCFKLLITALTAAEQ